MHQEGDSRLERSSHFSIQTEKNVEPAAGIPHSVSEMLRVSMRECSDQTGIVGKNVLTPLVPLRSFQLYQGSRRSQDCRTHGRAVGRASGPMRVSGLFQVQTELRAIPKKVTAERILTASAPRR